MSTVSPASQDQLRQAVRLAWPNLPVLLLGSLPVAVSWVALRAVPPHASWLAVVGVGLVVLPALGALVRGCEELLAEESFGLRDLVPTLVRTYPRAVRVTMLPTAAGLLTLLSVSAWRLSHQGWMLASVGAGLAATVVTAVVGIVALPYSLRTGATVRQTWLVSCYVATRNPVPVLGVLSSLALGIWAAVHLSFALVLLLPAPLALIWAAALAAATRRSQDRLAARVPPPV